MQDRAQVDRNRRNKDKDKYKEKDKDNFVQIGLMGFPARIARPALAVEAAGLQIQAPAPVRPETWN